MRLGLLVPALLGVLAAGGLWFFVLRPDDTAAKVRAARERAERTRAQNELVEGESDWRSRFEWLKEGERVQSASAGDLGGSTVEALLLTSEPQATVFEASLPREDSAVAALEVGEAAAFSDSEEDESRIQGTDEVEAESLEVTLQLSTADGELLADQSVSVFPLDSESSQSAEHGFSDLDGRLTLTLPVGGYRLRSINGEVEFEVRQGRTKIDLLLE